MNLDNTIAAIVSGGASGLGAATARALATQGVKVGVFDIDADNGERLAREIGGCFAQVDVSDEAAVKAGFKTIRADHGQESIFVNCAGIGSGMKTASIDRNTGEPVAHDLDYFKRVVAINLFGSFACLSQSAAGMLTLPQPLEGATRGVLINTGSIAAEDGQIGQVAYAAAKGGVVSATLPMARDLARSAIRCATILPGLFDTPIYDRRPGGAERRAKLSQHLQFPPRFGRAEEYASLALEICRNDYINGVVYRLDGGVRLGPR
ncbi:MAG TPA: SDR family oxidoreductase [Caulobacterales bacterium]|nr:SDR family oxidoreductase [Caulobacterales bacterium]